MDLLVVEQARSGDRDAYEELARGSADRLYAMKGTFFESFDPMTGIASLDVDATRAYGAGIRLPDGRVALIADDPLQQQKNAIDIVTIGP